MSGRVDVALSMTALGLASRATAAAISFNMQALDGGGFFSVVRASDAKEMRNNFDVRVGGVPRDE